MKKRDKKNHEKENDDGLLYVLFRPLHSFSYTCACLFVSVCVAQKFASFYKSKGIDFCF